MNTNCPIYKKCGSCQYLDISYQKQLDIKKQDIESLFKNEKITLHDVVPSLLTMGYRNKVIVAFNQKYEYGLYEEKSHHIIPYQKCLLHEDIMDEILIKIQRILKKYRVSIYDEKRGRGLLRHVLIRRAVKTNQTMVVLVCNDQVFPGSKNFCKELMKSFPSIQTVVLNINKRKTPIVLGNQEKVLYGKGFIVDELCGIKFKISSKSFYQINHDQCVQLYQKAISLLELKGKETVIDAYCGIGTIGMIMAHQVKDVLGIELNKDAIGDAKNNARMNRIDNIHFICDDATKYMIHLANQNHKVDALMMDPPRSGSTKEFIDAAIKLSPQKIVYISCGPDTQVRDLQYFKKKGYTYQDVYLYDMFPYTSHVETIVLMTKVDK